MSAEWVGLDEAEAREVRLREALSEVTSHCHALQDEREVIRRSAAISEGVLRRRLEVLQGRIDRLQWLVDEGLPVRERGDWDAFWGIDEKYKAKTSCGEG
jgi:hypothetical protein